MNKVMIISTVGLIYDGITNVILTYLKAMDLTDVEIYVTGAAKVECDIRRQFEELGCVVVELPNRRERLFSYVIALTKYIKKKIYKLFMRMETAEL